MDIDLERVRQVALLARLDLSDEELRRFAGELGRVLEYMEQIESLGRQDTAPAPEPLPQAQPPRDDHPGGEPLDRQQALSGAPATDGRFFLVPRVVEYPE
jgi:aspartyl-tRNA(Asn)/glutamyl-tRNA(Gln) amidotransferase subunit C